jgi:hypothetical protein
MKKHIKTIWFNPLGQTIGIVIFETPDGQRHARIGMGLGQSEHIDKQRIMEHGQALRLDQLIEIYGDVTAKLEDKPARPIN